jgi:hypothetical protein
MNTPKLVARMAILSSLLLVNEVFSAAYSDLNLPFDSLKKIDTKPLPPNINSHDEKWLSDTNRLVIYPNLSKEEISFIIPKDEKPISINIRDVKGTKTPIKPKDALNNTISIANLKKGNYWLEVETEKTTRIASFFRY